MNVCCDISGHYNRTYRLERVELNGDLNDPLGLQLGPFMLGMVSLVEASVEAR